MHEKLIEKLRIPEGYEAVDYRRVRGEWWLDEDGSANQVSSKDMPIGLSDSPRIILRKKEPKFKKGDYVVFGKEVARVISLREEGYLRVEDAGVGCRLWGKGCCTLWTPKVGDEVYVDGEALANVHIHGRGRVKSLEEKDGTLRVEPLTSWDADPASFKSASLWVYSFDIHPIEFAPSSCPFKPGALVCNEHGDLRYVTKEKEVVGIDGSCVGKSTPSNWGDYRPTGYVEILAYCFKCTSQVTDALRELGKLKHGEKANE